MTGLVVLMACQKEREPVRDTSQTPPAPRRPPSFANIDLRNYDRELSEDVEFVSRNPCDTSLRVIGPGGSYGTAAWVVPDLLPGKYELKIEYRSGLVDVSPAVQVSVNLDLVKMEDAPVAHPDKCTFPLKAIKGNVDLPGGSHNRLEITGPFPEIESIWFVSPQRPL